MSVALFVYKAKRIYDLLGFRSGQQAGRQPCIGKTFADGGVPPHHHLHHGRRYFAFISCLHEIHHGAFCSCLFKMEVVEYVIPFCLSTG